MTGIAAGAGEGAGPGRLASLALLLVSQVAAMSTRGAWLRGRLLSELRL